MSGVTAKKVKTDGRMHTYKIYLSDATTSTVSGTIKFENSADPSKTTDMTVTIKDAGMKFESDGTIDPSVKITPNAVDANGYQTGAEVKIDLAAFAGKSYKFRVYSPIAPQAGDLPTLACPDLTINEGAHDWEADEPYTDYTIQPSGDPVSKEAWTKLTFKNPLALTDSLVVAPSLAVQMKKDFTKPVYSVGTTSASWSTFNIGLTSSATEIEMYRVNGSAVTVSVECSSEEIEFTAPTGMSVTRIGATEEYVVAVTDTAALADKKEADLVVYNKKAKESESTSTTRQATIKLKMKDSAITWEMTGDAGGNAVAADDNITVDSDNMKGSDELTLTISGYQGSGIAVTVPGNSWFKRTETPEVTEIDASGTAVLTFKIDGGTGTDDITITVSNAITGGPDKTITLKKKAVVTPP